MARLLTLVAASSACSAASLSAGVGPRDRTPCLACSQVNWSQHGPKEATYTLPGSQLLQLVIISLKAPFAGSFLPKKGFLGAITASEEHTGRSIHGEAGLATVRLQVLRVRLEPPSDVSPSQFKPMGAGMAQWETLTRG